MQAPKVVTTRINESCGLPETNKATSAPWGYEIIHCVLAERLHARTRFPGKLEATDDDMLSSPLFTSHASPLPDSAPNTSCKATVGPRRGSRDSSARVAEVRARHCLRGTLLIPFADPPPRTRSSAKPGRWRAGWRWRLTGAAGSGPALPRLDSQVCTIHFNFTCGAKTSQQEGSCLGSNWDAGWLLITACS